jgi:hypothetical protein
VAGGGGGESSRRGKGREFFVTFVFDQGDSWVLVSDYGDVSVIVFPVSEEITLHLSDVGFT